MLPRSQMSPFALIVFSHGLSWPDILHQSLVDHIAIRGYIVVVVTHPHDCLIAQGFACLDLTEAFRKYQNRPNDIILNSKWAASGMKIPGEG
jgi:hypothetical protein